MNVLGGELEHGPIILGMLKCCKLSHHLTRLRSVVGEREEWSADGETAGTKPERNAAAEPQTEARR